MVIKSTLHNKALRAVHEASTRRFAAIDIGTNTILMLIAELEGNGAFRVLDDQAEIARLGEGVDRTRRIGSGGEERSVGVLKSYLKRCRGRV